MLRACGTKPRTRSQQRHSTYVVSGHSPSVVACLLRCISGLLRGLLHLLHLQEGVRHTQQQDSSSRV
jgi:hypothetical protein